MKNYSTDMVKLLALLLATPVLVMAYTKIERTVSPAASEQSREGMTGITPVSIGLMNNDNAKDADLTVPGERNEYKMVKEGGGNTGERAIVQNDFSNRFSLVLL